MFKLTPTEARQKWVEALRSSEFGQCVGQLRENDEFCCLGVGCEVFRRAEGLGEWVETAGDVKNFSIFHKTESGCLPGIVKDWLGLAEDSGDLIDVLDVDEDFSNDYSLIDLNDNDRLNFDQIADVIDANLVALAT